MTPTWLALVLFGAELVVVERIGLDGRGLGELGEAHPVGRVVEIHEEVVVVEVDRQLEGLGHLLVAEEVGEELPGQVVDLRGEVVQYLR